MENTNEYDIAGAEVYNFLSNIPKDKYKKIPEKIINLFEKYQNYNLGKKVDLTKKFDDQEISLIAKDVIFYISYNYLFTEEQKKRTLQQMKINEEKLKEQYDIDKIFQQRKVLEKPNSIVSDSIERNSENEKTKSLIETKKETIFTRFINFFKKLFKK